MAILVKLSKAVFPLSLAALVGCASASGTPRTNAASSSNQGYFDHQVALCSVRDALFLRRIVAARTNMGIRTSVEEAGDYVLKVANSCATDPVETQNRLIAIDQKMVAAGLIPPGPSEQELEEETAGIEARLRLMERNGESSCLKK